VAKTGRRAGGSGGKAPGTEGARRATGVAGGGAAPGEARRDPEVPERAQRRRFTAEYKLAMLDAADACREPGEVGALLRREGLYTSHLSVWRQQRREGALDGLSPNKRGRKLRRTAEARQVEQLEREVKGLREELRKAHVIIDVQKKGSSGFSVGRGPGPRSGSRSRS